MKKLAFFIALLVGLVIVGLGSYQWLQDPERKDLDQDARDLLGGSYLRLSQGVVHYELGGPVHGETLVLLHGFSVPGYIWDNTFRYFTDAGYRVLRFDLYGRGYSDRPDVAYDGALFVQQLHELVTALELPQPFNLVGLSMGGPIAALYADEHASSVRRLALVAPLTVVPTAEQVRPLTRPLLGNFLATTSFMPGLLAGQSKDFADPQRVPDWQQRFAEQMEYRGFRRAILSTIKHLPDLDTLGAYEQLQRQGFPVRLFWGTEDRTVPLAHSEQLLELLPRAELILIPDTGHVPMVESFERFNPLLADFLTVSD